MGLTSDEITNIKAKIDAGSYTMTNAMNEIAYANRGGKIRSTLYSIAYWLKKYHQDSVSGIDSKQVSLTAGTNITLSTRTGYDQTISATDTLNTVGAGAIPSTTSTYYLVLSPSTGETSAQSYTSSKLYYSNGALYANGKMTRASTPYGIVTKNTGTGSSTSDALNISSYASYRYFDVMATWIGYSTNGWSGVLKIEGYNATTSTWVTVATQSGSSPSVGSSTPTGLSVTYTASTMDDVAYTQYRAVITLASSSTVTSGQLRLMVF